MLRGTKPRSNYGAGDRTRTGTPSLAVDFESTTSTIPSHRRLPEHYSIYSTGMQEKIFQEWLPVHLP